MLLLGIVLFPMTTYAQEIETPPTDDLGNVSDAFQENFFEALKQKGIENYELALIALEKAKKAGREKIAFRPAKSTFSSTISLPTKHF